MSPRIRKHLTFANVISMIALFVALSGGAYAAMKIPRNSIGPAQLKAGSVDSGKVRDGTLVPKDFKLGSLPAGIQGPKGDAGAEGPAGPSGPKGETGARGADGARGQDGSHGQDGADGVSVTTTQLGTGDANCPNGGTRFTSAGGTTYACNGAKGDQGPGARKLKATLTPPAGGFQADADLIGSVSDRSHGRLLFLCRTSAPTPADTTMALRAQGGPTGAPAVLLNTGYTTMTQGGSAAAGQNGASVAANGTSDLMLDTTSTTANVWKRWEGQAVYDDGLGGLWSLTFHAVIWPDHHCDVSAILVPTG